jgi:hypothetical protein
MLPEMLVKEVGHLLEVVKERKLSIARKVVHLVLAMFDSHYHGLDRTALSGGWAPGSSDDHCDQLKEDCAAFTRAMADVAMRDLNLIPQYTLEVQDDSRASH